MMNDDMQKIAIFYDQLGRELFHKFAQAADAAPEEAESGAEFGTGGKPKLLSLVQKLVSAKGKK